MSEPKKTYTAIPDTSDRNYWRIKSESARDRLKIFEPVDKALHKELKAKLWAAIQARLPRIRRGQIV